MNTADAMTTIYHAALFATFIWGAVMSVAIYYAMGGR